MFIFYHTKQSRENKNYYKGQLFECLLADYLRASGFNVEIRQKRSSLEYDLNGCHDVDGHKVIGEAKAHGKPIAGDVVSGFVGKLVPLGLADKSVSGLFLSTSPLTAEADDYLTSVQESNFTVTCHAGEPLEERVRKTLGMVSVESLKTELRLQGLSPLMSHILATDLGYFLVVVSAAADEAAASFFSIYRRDGTQIRDKQFLSSVKESIDDLAELTAVAESEKTEVKRLGREIPWGLTVGDDWDDYRLPAAPGFFVGRRAIYDDLLDTISSSEGHNLVQIKSRSGVGKSSLLAFLGEQLLRSNWKVELHDARDIKSLTDLLTVVRRFCSSDKTPADIHEAELMLRDFSQSLSGGSAAFIVDQFETHFQNPELFAAYECLGMATLSSAKNVRLILARKNDQLTTFDDSQISLDRLNQLSKSYQLKDFDVKEAAQLIDRISEKGTKKVSKEVRAFVMEFAQGFPWLIKRTMSHIVRLVNKGVAQKELFAAGLRLDELFDEELEGLDELERDYLVRLANRLPASFQELQRQFDEDPFLRKVLDKLTRVRLLRLTGASYDTYNDVFKEYLIYQRLPDFRQTHIHRIWPQTIFRQFHKFVENPRIKTEEGSKLFGVSKGAFFNSIKEMRSVGLVKKEGEEWVVPKIVMDIYDRGTLGEFIRRNLMENGAVADLVASVTRSEKGVRSHEVSEFLKRRFVFIDASDSTWEVYGRILVGWLTALRLLDIADGYLVRPEMKRAKIIEELGNVRGLGRRGRLKDHMLFLPTAFWANVISTLERLIEGETPSTKQEKKALGDLRGLGLYDGHRLRTFSIEEATNIARERLQRPEYKEVWQVEIEGGDVRKPIRDLVGSDIAESTADWRRKILLHWGRELGLIAKSRKNSKKNPKQLTLDT